ncbi:MAG: hypothetical protein P4M11_08670 [Candidatus Pacebacteria bacterium]|nr:hypothetical protein [Candidatus Paceibacterota bacterium]
MTRRRSENRQKQVIKKHIPHDQEVKPLNRNYIVGLDDATLIDMQKVSILYCSPSIPPEHNSPN